LVQQYFGPAVLWLLSRDREVAKTQKPRPERPTDKQASQENTQMTLLRNLWNDEQGQDLIEYTLLMAFVALASAALFIGAGGSIKGIWTTSNSQLEAANTSAS
jgi:Flp pilus assembly pilin Flp